MRVARVVVVALAGLLTVARPARADDKKSKPGLFDFESWKTPVAREREAARQISPGELDLTPALAHAGPPRPVRLRVYADRDYRQTVLRWQVRLRGQIDRLNRVVGPVFGVRFEIESLRDWNRSHLGAALEPVLAELEGLDPARDVDWVVGLVTPFRGVAKSIHQIGATRLLARHFVLRGMDDEEEGQALDRELHLLSVDERGKIYSDRKAHKESVVFLHEWAHTLGALHNEDPTVIMNPAYDPRQAAFSDFEKRLVALVVERRLARRSELFPESQGQDLEALLGSAPSDEGSDRERAALIDLARQRARGGGEPAPGVIALPAADAATYNQVVEALNAGQRAEAWSRLAPLVQPHPRQPAVGALACQLVAGQPHAQEARAACDDAAGLAPRDPRPLLEAAAAYLRVGDTARAAPLVLAGAGRAAAGPADAKVAMRVAELAGGVGALTTGETALGQVGRAQPEYADEVRRLSGELDAARRRLALPRDAARWGIPPEGEPAFAAAFREAESTLSSRDAAAARARLRDFAAAYPDAPATDVLTCDVELRAHHAGLAARRCEAALAKFDEATRAHFLLGFMAAATGRDVVAEKHFRQVIMLDPRDESAWRELARLYRATRATGRLVQLRAQHETLLSSPLPE